MRKGFTLIELMIVIAIIAIIASIAIPNLLESRITANEGAASASMKSAIFAGQTQFQAGAYQDSDGNGVGEFGHIQDLAGARATIGASAGDIGLVTGQLAQIASGATTATQSNYNFCAFTVNNDATAKIQEGTALAAAITEQDAEINYIIAAAPNILNEVGRRVFLMAQDGQLRSPSAVARRNTWFTSADRSTAVSILAGVDDALGTDTDVTTITDSTYPFYSK